MNLRFTIYNLRLSWRPAFALCLMLMLTGISRAAELNVVSNASFCRFCSSYFSPLNCAGMYEDSGRYLYWPNLNIHCYENSRSGGSIQEANENRLERRGLAEWANGSQYWGEIWTDNNGGYTTATQVYAQLTNTFKAPDLFFNGTVYTNEGGWATTHAGQITNWILGGNIPVDGHYLANSDGDIRNGAFTNIAAGYGFIGFDVYHVLNDAYGWSNDIATSADLRLSIDGEHPGAPGALGMAVVADQAQMDTNINTTIIDWSGHTVAFTNHCVVTGVTLTGSTLTFNWPADRHSMAWDCPDGTITNDAGNAFVMNPALSNAFFEVIRFTNAPPNATFTISEDSSNILTVTSSQLTNGVNLFAVTKGALWAQRKEVLGRIRDKRYCNRVTLVNGLGSDHKGEAGYDNDSQGWWDAGARGDSLISDLAPNILDLNSNDMRIWAAAQPTNHVFSFSQNPGPPPLFAPFQR